MPTFTRLHLWLGAAVGFLLISVAPIALLADENVAAGPRVFSLDGDGWKLAHDPQNVGRQERWFEAVRPDAKATKVPWIMQDAFPGCHGVFWYWRNINPPEHPLADGRWILRFWDVDYRADVWLNGREVGSHEGGQGMFELDVTDAIKPGADNLLSVRVLNPTDNRIDGYLLRETPARNKQFDFHAGSGWDVGGIMDSVELIAAPAVRITDIWTRPDWETGVIRVQATVRNAGSGTDPAASNMRFSVAPAMSGETILASETHREFSKGDTVVDVELKVPDFRLWSLGDPNLYRVTVRLGAGSAAADERSVRCGFRDFRFANGYFRLNGKRIYLRCSHDGDNVPVGIQIPLDPDMLRRDLYNAKVMGFNAIRTISALFKRQQLDLCDELGLMVYEEAFSAWLLHDSPHMAERFDRSNREMILRDRNHPCITIWGMLNENPDNAVFRHAVKTLPLIRSLDDTRLVLLNSGHWDYQPDSTASWPGLEIWQRALDPAEAQKNQAAHTDVAQVEAISNDLNLTPNVTHNPTNDVISGVESNELAPQWTVWKPGEIGLHPGPKAEFAVLRWTCPASGDYRIEARFHALSLHSMTNVYVLHNNRLLHFGSVDVGGDGGASNYEGVVNAKEGDTIDFVAGTGIVNDESHTVGVTAVIILPEKTFDSPGMSLGANKANQWSCGYYAGLATPQASTFKRFPVVRVIPPPGKQPEEIGGLSNPGSNEWENVISDLHPYQPVPHTVGLLHMYRALQTDKPIFASEYGIASSIDLVRVVQHYERIGREDAEDARFYRQRRDRFLADWRNWKMAEAFGRPEDFFLASERKMADDRLFGMNAIRANPNIVGHSLTGTVDQGMTGEGLFTTWRELKPGAIDAMFDAWAPLRWCLFAEPVQIYSGSKVRLDAVLANEDQLSPRDYPADIQLFDPDNKLVWEKKTTVTIPKAAPGAKELPLAIPVSSDEVVVKGPPGKYRLTARFEHGAAPAGRDAVVYVADPNSLPERLTKLNEKYDIRSSGVAVWGDDPELIRWLEERHITWNPFTAKQTEREVILCGYRPLEPAAEQFAELARHVACGSTAIFVCPETLAEGKDTARWLPFAKKGIHKEIGQWLYHKEEWAKPHPIFAGLPTGMMDYVFYRDIVSCRDWVLPETPDEVICAANNPSIDYKSGLLVFTKEFGEGKFIINGLRIRENLGQNPVADRLLLNMLNYAAEGHEKPLAELPADFDKQLQAIGYAKK